MTDKKTLITITGPSTTGKSTLADFFKPEGYKEIVSTTTRPPRTGEVDGVSYNFVNEETFKEMLKNDQLIEHILVGPYYYGVSKKAISDVLDNGFPGILVVEPNGANRVGEFCKEKNISLHKVFINNTMDVLVQRLQSRYATDTKATKEVYKERLWNIAFVEPKEWTEKAYSGEHHYDQIFNTFVPENQKAVFLEVLEFVNRPMNNTNKKKP